MAARARPRLQISRETLSKLRPRALRKVKFSTASAPDLPTLDQKLADIAPTMLPNAPTRPKVELNAGAAPLVAHNSQTGEATPPLELGSAQSAVKNGEAITFIALPAAPHPTAPVVPP